jgi:hypothetical protein
MNDFPITVSYPSTDKGYATLSMRVFRAGNALMLSPNGEHFSFGLYYNEAKEMLAAMFDCSFKRIERNMHPFPTYSELHLDRGVFEIDSEIADELIAALVDFIAENEIGSMLDQFKPE